MNPPLAIVGASARAAAASALRAGFQPVAADLFADADLRRIATATRVAPYPDGLLDWLRSINPPAWMYTGALENHPNLVDQMGWIAPLWGNPGDVLARVRSPLELAHALTAAGLLFPETRTSADGLPCDGSWLTKTYRGASGSGVRALDERGRQGEWETRRYDREGSSEKGPPALPLSPSPPLFFQRRIPGTPASAVFVAADGAATLLGAARQLIGCEWLGAHGFQFAGSIAPLLLSDTALATIKKVGNTIAEQFELVGLFGLDFILASDDVWTIEVNPRYTASVEVVERATGVHAVAAHAHACSEGSLGSRAVDLPRPPAPAVSAKATLFARREITIGHAFADWSLAEATRTPWPALADTPAAGTEIHAGRPILTLFADGGTAEEVEQHLRQRVAELEQELYDRN